MFNAAILLAQQCSMTVNGQFITGRVIESESHGMNMNTLSSTCEAIANASIVGSSGRHYRETHLALYRTVPSDTVTTLAVAKLFARYNWTPCILIYQNDAFGTGGAQAATDVFLDRGLLISDVLVFQRICSTAPGRHARCGLEGLGAERAEFFSWSHASR